MNKSWYEMGKKEGLIVDRFCRDRENLKKAQRGIENSEVRIKSYWLGWLDGYHARQK